MFNETEFAAFALPFFVKALGLTEDVIKEKSMTTEGQADLQKAYGEKRKAAKSEGYNEAMGKSQKTLEKLAKDTFGVEIPKGDDENPTDVAAVISAIKEGYTPEPGSPGQISDKDVKKHPDFLLMERRALDAEKREKEKDEKMEQTINDRVSKRSATLTLQQQGESALTELGAKLPTHEGQRKLAVEAYRNAYAGIEQRTVGDKTYYYEGDQRLEDEMGAPLSWDALKRKKAEQFFELEGPKRESPEAKNTESGNSGQNGKSVNLNPKTITELNGVLGNSTLTAEQRSSAKAYYQANGTDL